MAAELDFCKEIPKLELHAHLNGSISRRTLRKLSEKKGQTSSNAFFMGERRNYSEAFKTFKAIHELVKEPEDIELITKDVIKEFADDNVLYLELRTTPKCIHESGMLKNAYMKAVINGISAGVKESDNNITVKLLVSVDRGKGVKEAEENLLLALEYSRLYPEIIAGVDFSGNPHSGKVEEFIPVLEKANKYGLRMTVHLGEVPYIEENLQLLKLIPDRIGHGVFLHPDNGGSDELLKIMRNHKIPLEICLTSNLIGELVKNAEDHHFQYWYDHNHPLIICTDDKGIFEVNLSDEYYLAAKSFNLSRSQLGKLSFQAIDHIFASDDVKQNLKRIWTSKLESLGISL